MKQNPDNAYRPRLSIEITQDQSNRLRKLIPWGLKNQLFSVLTDDVIRLAEQHGPTFLAAILARSIGLENYTSLEVPSNDND